MQTPDRYGMLTAVASGKKLRRARRVAWWISLLPSIRLVAVCNSVAMCSARADSDIDFFIVTEPKTIALTRGILLMVLSLAGMRPRPEKESDAICASFFVTTNALDMSVFALEGDDPYLQLWQETLMPLRDRGNTYDQFVQINNLQPIVVPEWHGAVCNSGKITQLATRFMQLLEPLAQKMQHHFFSDEILQRMNKGSDVVVNENVLKFHTNDRRIAFRNAWYAAHSDTLEKEKVY